MDTEELAFLRTVPCFRGLPTAELIQVQRGVRRRELRAGELIVRAGQRADTLYVVRRGHVHLAVPTVGGTDRVLAVQGPGSTFNETAVCGGGPAATTARALGANTCIDEVPAALVSHLLADHPRLGAHLVQAEARHIRRLAALIGDRAWDDSARR